MSPVPVPLHEDNRPLPSSIRPTDAEIVERFGTPTYVYDLDEMRLAHADLVRSLPAPSRLLYSLKANPHPRVVEALSRLGCGLELSSTGELARAVEAHAPPDGLVLTGPAKGAALVGDFLTAGGTVVSTESARDLAQVGRIAAWKGRRARCIVRVNVDEPVSGVPLAFGGAPTQFGVDAAEVRRRPGEFVGSADAPAVGWHLYQAGNVGDPAALAAVTSASITTARRLADVLDAEPEVLDLGGGFGAPYAATGSRISFADYRAPTEALLDRSFPGWRHRRPEVVFESGRYLVGTAGRLLTRVVDVKESKGQAFVLLDSGIHHLGGMSGLRRVPPLAPTLVTGRAAGADPARARVVGPLCTPLDCWAPAADLPALEPGDTVVVPNAGAYGLTASLLGFLSHSAPIEVVVEGGAIIGSDRLVLDRRAVD